MHSCLLLGSDLGVPESAQVRVDIQVTDAWGPRPLAAKGNFPVYFAFDRAPAIAAVLQEDGLSQSMLSAAPQTTCTCCGAASSSLKRCGRCHAASYCSVDCQRNDWKAGHKAACIVSDGAAAMPVRGQPAGAQQHPPRAPEQQPPAAPGSAEERVAPLLDELRTTMAGTDTRRLLVVELSEMLTAEASNKGVVREFLDAEGPEIVYDIQSCMRGNWVADAKNGTMSKLSNLSRRAAAAPPPPPPQTLGEQSAAILLGGARVWPWPYCGAACVCK